jgi:hypothetical protein
MIYRKNAAELDELLEASTQKTASKYACKNPNKFR